MRDQENPKEKLVSRGTGGPPSPPVLMSEKEKWRFYLKESSHFRAVHGFGWKEGKLTIVDPSKLKGLDEVFKAILRELYLEMR